MNTKIRTNSYTSKGVRELKKREKEYKERMKTKLNSDLSPPSKSTKKPKAKAKIKILNPENSNEPKKIKVKIKDKLITINSLPKSGQLDRGADTKEESEGDRPGIRDDGQ